MIIECQQCRARFKLDESRIKGKGARIRCRKCGESIIVMKKDFEAASPSAPPAGKLFDLRSALRESVGKPPAPGGLESSGGTGPMTSAPEAATPPEEHPAFASRKGGSAADSFPMHGADAEPATVSQERPAHRVEEPGEDFPTPPPGEADAPPAGSPTGLSQEEEPESPDPSVEAAPEPPGILSESPSSGPRSEVYEEFDRPLFGKGDSEPPAPPGEEIEVGFGDVLRRDAAPPAETGRPSASGDADGPFSFQLVTDEDLSFLSATGPEATLRPDDDSGGQHPFPSSGKGETGPETDDLRTLETVLPDFLRRKDPPGKPAEEFDISRRLSDTPQFVLEEEDSPATPPPVRPSLSLEDPKSRAEEIQEEISGMAETPAADEDPAPRPSAAVLFPAGRAETEGKRASRPLPAAPSGRPSFALLVVLFLAIAGGGAYLAFTKAGQETLRAVVPGLESFWLGGKEAVRPYQVGNLIGYYETSDKAGKLFVIKGTVTNEGRTKKSGIRVRAELLDGSRRSIAERTVFAGNVIPTLRSADRDRIEAAMSNRFGDKLSNVDVSPGNQVSFMVVFVDPPPGIEEYRLAAFDGE